MVERKLKKEQAMQGIIARESEGLRVDVMVPQPARQKQSLQTTMSLRDGSLEGVASL